MTPSEIQQKPAAKVAGNRNRQSILQQKFQARQKKITKKRKKLKRKKKYELVRIGQNPKKVKITFSCNESMKEGAGTLFGGKKKN